MKRKYLYLIAIFVFIISGSAFSQEKTVSSPDGKNTISITTQNEISYEVKRNGKVVIAKSPILMKVGEKEWGKDSRPRKVSTESFQEEVSLTIPRKSKVINEEYNKILLAYRDYMVEFRVYNDGVAYRFIGKKDEEKPIVSESVVFNLPEDYNTYTLLTDKLQNWFEEEYTIKNLSSLPQDSFSISPVMVNAENCKLLIAEANLVNYPGMYLQPSGKSFKGIFAYYPHTEEIRNNGNKLYAIEREEYLVKTDTKRTFPWRVIGIFENDADMLSSDLTYLLSDEESPEYDFSWIKPGKVLWDWWNGRNIYNVDFVSGINTKTYLYMIDYAKKHGLEYILIDEGWSAKDNLMELNPDVDIPGQTHETFIFPF